MVVLNRIYTRTGDGGDTALSDGSRVAKHDPRVDAYGTVDEINAMLGLSVLACLAPDGDPDLAKKLSVIQNDLFDLGADLSRPGLAHETDRGEPVLRVVQAQVDRLEAEIDAMNAGLDPLRSFILPGGTPAAAHLHMARTLARRAERRATELATQTEVNPVAIKYLNRLSDWLFVASRIANLDHGGDILWVPGASR